MEGVRIAWKHFDSREVTSRSYFPPVVYLRGGKEARRVFSLVIALRVQMMALLGIANQTADGSMTFWSLEKRRREGWEGWQRPVDFTWGSGGCVERTTAWKAG